MSNYSYPAVTFGAKNENITYRSISATLSGSCQYEETDMGPWVETHAPGADYDFETISTVEGNNVDKLLIELIKDRFEGQVEFREYLENKGITYDFFCW